ncbi:MAG: hypothetical protein LBL84_03940, partial [Candidatus Nomurabacteria bacterium]|nr:hypothetical protein [Candidatus Nomurabacteria bacterium]
DRIYIFNREDAESFRDNPSLVTFMAAKNMECLFVDHSELRIKRPDLLETLGDGWIGIDESVLLVDLPTEGISRGYVTFSRAEITRANQCFDELRAMAVPLKQLVKT